MTWRIWFAEGSSVEGRTLADWLAVPSAAVLCVGVRYPSPPGHPRGSLLSGDWFWWDGEPHCGAQTAVTGYWTPPPDVDEATLKRGSLVSDEQWEQTRLEMVRWVRRG